MDTRGRGEVGRRTAKSAGAYEAVPKTVLHEKPSLRLDVQDSVTMTCDLLRQISPAREPHDRFRQAASKANAFLRFFAKSRLMLDQSALGFNGNAAVTHLKGGIDSVSRFQGLRNHLRRLRTRHFPRYGVSLGDLQSHRSILVSPCNRQDAFGATSGWSKECPAA